MVKKKFIISLSTIFVLFLVIVLCIESIKNPVPSVPNNKFDDYTNSLFKSMLPRDSFTLHYYLNFPDKYNIENVSSSIGRFDYKSISQEETYYTQIINDLKGFDYTSLSDENKRTYDSLLFVAKNEMDFPDYILNYEMLTPTTGIQAQLPILLNQYTFNTEKDVEDYLKILSTIPNYFNDICEFQCEKSAKGYFMNHENATAIIQQCKDFSSSSNNILISDFPSRLSVLGITDTTKLNDYIHQNTLAVNKYVLPSYVHLADTLSKLIQNSDKSKNNCQLSSYPKGKNYYNYLVKSYTGSSRTIHDIEKMIKTKLSNDVKILLKYSRDNDVLSEIENTDNKPIEPTKIIDNLIDSINSDFPKPKSLNYELKEVPKSMENHLSPAFYIVPPIDSPYSNCIYINNIDNNGYIDIYSTLAHEGYPGHLYQCNYFSASNPSLIRNLLDFDGYSEGWATYCEMYCYKYLFKNSETAEYMAANTSYSLALHALCDIWINYRGWDKETIKSHLLRYGITDNETANAIYTLAIESPANYLKYYVGYLEILSLKESYKETLGTRYSDKKFHSFIMKQGPAPFDVIKKNIP